MKTIIEFFDKLEDKVRSKLSHQPILYAFIGGTGVIIFWRGIWHLNDYVSAELSRTSESISTINLGSLPWWDSVLSIIVGGTMLLITGIFVPTFIGNEVILTGLKKEKKLTEKTEAEVETELEKIKEVQREMREVSKKLSRIEKSIK